MKKPKYNHAYTLAFSVDTDDKGGNLSEAELLQAVLRRLVDLRDNKELIEAIGMPFDSFENPSDTDYNKPEKLQIIPQKELSNMVHSFDYIEKVRAYGANKQGKEARLPKEKLADLYYSGLYIYKLACKYGNEDQNNWLRSVVNHYKESFR